MGVGCGFYTLDTRIFLIFARIFMKNDGILNSEPEHFSAFSARRQKYFTP